MARSIVLGILTGLALILVAAFVITGGLGPPPGDSDVCREVPGPALDDRVTGNVERAEVCGEIDGTLDAPLGGPDGFEGVLKAPAPPSDPSTLRPAYLVWETDGCSAPVLGAGPFDFTLACTRHDFGWRNLKRFHEVDAPVWHVGNKDRVDAGFFYDMRLRCSALPRLQQIGCDTTARIYYTAVHLNPSGVAALPGRNP